LSETVLWQNSIPHSHTFKTTDMVKALLRNAAHTALYEQLPTDLKTHDAILAEFIKATFATLDGSPPSCRELTDLLKARYGFDLPEGVVHATVGKMLPNLVRHDLKGNYLFDPKEFNGGQKILAAYQSLTALQQQLLASLFAYIAATQKRPLDPEQEASVTEIFYLYLFDRERTEPLARQIDDFLQSHAVENKAFSKNLKKLRKAVILYEGLHFHPRADGAVRLHNELTIFLDAEKLLDAVGYNDAGPRKRFEEFYALVVECNRLNKKNDPRQVIKLRYLNETQSELQLIFGDPAKTSRCEQQLKKLDILFYPFTIPDNNCLEYGLHDPDTLHNAAARLSVRFPGLADLAWSQPLHLFSKINCLRQGNLARRVEEARYVYLTDQPLPLQLACHTRIRFLPRYIPFAVDMPYLTNRLWSILKKGFMVSRDFNPDFNRIARTFSVLQGLVGRSLITKYERQIKALKAGKPAKKRPRKRTNSSRDKNRNDDNTTAMQAYTLPERLRKQRTLEELARQVQQHEQMLREAQKKMELIVARLAKIEEQVQHLMLTAPVQRNPWERSKKTDSIYSKGNWDTLRIALLPYAMALLRILLRLLIHPGG
jgi:uncharacterized coiled-coil protein SlyX